MVCLELRFFRIYFAGLFNINSAIEEEIKKQRPINKIKGQKNIHSRTILALPMVLREPSTRPPITAPTIQYKNKPIKIMILILYQCLRFFGNLTYGAHQKQIRRGLHFPPQGGFFAILLI